MRFAPFCVWLVGGWPEKSFANPSRRRSFCSSQAIKYSYAGFKQLLYFSLESGEFQSWEKDDSYIKFPYSVKFSKETSL